MNGNQRTDCELRDHERDMVCMWINEEYNRLAEEKSEAALNQNLVQSLVDNCKERYKLTMSPAQCESSVVIFLLAAMSNGWANPHFLSGCLIWYLYGRTCPEQNQAENAPGPSAQH